MLTDGKPKQPYLLRADGILRVVFPANGSNVAHDRRNYIPPSPARDCLLAGELNERETTSTPFQATAQFTLRYEEAGGERELNIPLMDLTGDLLSRWESILLGCLPASTYHRLKEGFRLKLWRRPQWVSTVILQDNLATAEASLRSLHRLIVPGDILWLTPACMTGPRK
jgi:hypothetical protein